MGKIDKKWNYAFSVDLFKRYQYQKFVKKVFH